MINIDKYEVKNSSKIEYMYESRIAKNNYQVEIRKLTSVPDMLSFNILMKTPLTRAMKKREYDAFMTAILGNTIDSEDYYIQYINQLYKSAEFDYTTKAESIENIVTNVLSVIAIGSALIIISGGVFGFAVPVYIATAGQVAGGILTAKDIGHLITGKDINGNPLGEADRQAITSSLIVEASMLAVNSLSKLKLKYANKANRLDDIGNMKTTNTFEFGSNVKNHLKNVEKVTTKEGISGGHNMNEFNKALKS